MNNLGQVAGKKHTTNPKTISRTSPYFDKDDYAAFNKQVLAYGRENISENFKNKIDALVAETDFYEANEFEVSVLTGAPIWRLRDFRSAKNYSYPFRKLCAGKPEGKKDVGKVVYPLVELKKSLASS